MEGVGCGVWRVWSVWRVWGVVGGVVFTSRMKPNCFSWGSRNTYLFSPLGGVRRNTVLMLAWGSLSPGGLVDVSLSSAVSASVTLTPEKNEDEISYLSLPFPRLIPSLPLSSPLPLSFPSHSPLLPPLSSSSSHPLLHISPLLHSLLCPTDNIRADIHKGRAELLIGRHPSW